MNNTLNEILDPWMNTIHGQLYENSIVIRLATLFFCMSLPKSISTDLSNASKGDSSVTANLKPITSRRTSSGYTSSNVLEELLQTIPKEIIQKINIPLQYKKELHLQGAGFLKSFVLKNFNCDMHVTTVNKTDLKFELFHRPTLRYIGSFTIAN